MDLLELAARHVFLSISDRIRGIYDVRLNSQIMDSQYYSEEQIRDYQWHKLQLLLDYVYKNNNFYQQRLRQMGAEPGDFKSLSDFVNFPVLVKDDIRANLDSLISGPFDKSNLLRRRTGGSTGVPVYVYQDKQCQSTKEALVRRHNAWAQFIPGKKVASLWGDIKPPKLDMRIYNALIGRTIYLDTLKMDQANMANFAVRIKKTRSQLLFGHGHSIFFFAQCLRESNLGKLDFKGIISTAETLLTEERRVVEEVFGNVVFDRYGCEEMGLIASECEAHEGLHIAAEGVYLEIIGGDEQNPGKVLVTDLLNKGTPLIRYEIGDMATTRAGRCKCGRGLPRLGKVVGRTSDILYTPEGRMISGISLLDTFTIHIPGLRQVQIVQERLDEIIFNIVKDSNYSEASFNTLAKAVPKYFGPSMKFKVVFLDKIPLTGRGKFQYSICKIQPPSPGKD